MEGLYFSFPFLPFLTLEKLIKMFLCLSFPQDIRLLNAGKPAQHAAEVERELDKADNIVRLFFNDVQVLKDGRHPQAEQMYRRWVFIQVTQQFKGRDLKEIKVLVKGKYEDVNLHGLCYIISSEFTASMSVW